MEAKRFLKNELKMEVMVRKARKIGEKGHENVTVVDIGKWEKKREIMEKKKNLRKGVHIDDDITREERGVQRKFRDRTRKEKEGGKRARVRYRKIRVKDKWCRWKERIEGGKEEEKGENEGTSQVKKEPKA